MFIILVLFTSATPQVTSTNVGNLRNGSKSATSAAVGSHLGARLASASDIGSDGMKWVTHTTWVSHSAWDFCCQNCRWLLPTMSHLTRMSHITLTVDLLANKCQHLLSHSHTKENAHCESKSEPAYTNVPSPPSLTSVCPLSEDGVHWRYTCHPPIPAKHLAVV